MGNVCNGTNVRDRQRGIARRFDVHQLGVGTNRLFYSFQIRSVHNGRVHVELVFQQFVQQAVYGNIGHTGKYHMIAAFQQGEEQAGQCCHAACQHNAVLTTLQRSQLFL